MGGLLERERELEAIEAVVRQAHAGGGRVALVEGPPGIGKTALTEAAQRVAQDAGVIVLDARGAELERDFPLGVVRQLLEPALRALSEEERAAVAVGAAAVGEQALAGEPVQMFDAMHGAYWLLVNLAERAPVLVVVDDAHWSDVASLRWLAYVGNRLEDVPAGVVVATRIGVVDTATAEALDIVRRLPATDVVTPSALTEAAAADLLEQIFDDRPQAAFVSACQGQTAGNPLMLRELAKALAEDGVAPDAGAAATVTALPPRSALRAVHVRLGRLPAEATEFARAVAVLESDVALHDAAAVAKLDLDAATAAADALTTAGILAAGLPLRFEHPLLRAAVYNEIPPARRAAAHADAARRLRGAPELRDRVAAHLLATDPAAEPWVVKHLREAAGAAISAGAPGSAIVHLRRALLERPDTETRAKVLAELGTAEMSASGADAVAHLEEAIALAGSEEQRILLRRGLGNALVVCGRIADAYAQLEQARARIDADDREQALGVEAELLGAGLIAPSLAPRASDRIAALPELSGETKGERVVLANVARHLVLTGAPGATTADVARRAIAGGKLLHEHAPDSPTFPLAVAALTSVDRFPEVRQMVDLSLEDARRRGSPLGFGLGHILLIFLELRSGNLDASAEHARTVLDISHQVGFQIGVAVATSGLVEIGVNRGELDAADALLAQNGLAGPLPESVFSHSVLYARGVLKLAQGRRRDGLDDLLELGRREQLAGHACQDWLWRTAAAPALVAEGDRDAAQRLMQDELAASRRRGSPDALARALMTKATLEGRDAAIATLHQALALVEGTELELSHARAATDLGATLRREGRRVDAREHLRVGLELAHRCGATMLAARADQELRATGARPRNVMRSGVESLSVSERRVADLAAAGHSNKDIAQALFVTTKTVESQLAATYRKLGISSRNDLTATLRG